MLIVPTGNHCEHCDKDKEGLFGFADLPACGLHVQPICAECFELEKSRHDKVVATIATEEPLTVEQITERLSDGDAAMIKRARAVYDRLFRRD